MPRSAPLPPLGTPSPRFPALSSLPPRGPLLPALRAELERCPPSRAASGGGAKSRMFPAPAAQSLLPGAERRGGKRACGRRARGRRTGGGLTLRQPGAQPLRGLGEPPSHPGRRPRPRCARASPVGEVGGAVLGSRPFPGALGPRSTAHACRPGRGSIFGVAPSQGATLGFRLPAGRGEGRWMLDPGSPFLPSTRGASSPVSRSFRPEPPR